MSVLTFNLLLLGWSKMELNFSDWIVKKFERVLEILRESCQTLFSKTLWTLTEKKTIGKKIVVDFDQQPHACVWGCMVKNN